MNEVTTLASLELSGIELLRVFKAMNINFKLRLCGGEGECEGDEGGESDEEIGELHFGCEMIWCYYYEVDVDVVLVDLYFLHLKYEFLDVVCLCFIQEEGEVRRS